MTEPVVGIRHVRDEVEILPTLGAEMSVVGIVGTAPDANAETFPLNTPVYLTSNDKALVAALGASGTIPDAISGVSAQLGVGQGAFRAVVVRVEEGEDVDETIANIVGSESLGTGIWALLDAGVDLGVVPRINIVPGHTSQFTSGLSTLTLATQGSNLTEAPTVGFTGGGSDPGKVLPTAHAVLGTGDNAGKVVSLVIDTPGKNLSGSLTVTFTGGGSEVGKVLPTATAAIGALANPVIAIAPTILDRLRGVLIADGPSGTRQSWIDWRETIQSDRIIPLCVDVKVLDAQGNIVTRPSSPRIAGIAVRRDHEFEGRPFHSWANQAVRGIVGASRPIPFSLTDGAYEGQELIGLNGGIIVKGEAGIEDALAEGGFVYWGTDTCSEDPLWQFYHIVRGRDYIELSQIKALRYYLGRYNITLQTVNAILGTIESFLSSLKVSGDLLGYRVGFEPDANSPEDLRQGYLQVMFRAEEPPVLRKVTISSRRYRDALNDLANTIAVQLASGTTTA
jgi:phage tail sheath protein FI